MATLAALKAQTAIKGIEPNARLTFNGRGARLIVERAPNGELVTTASLNGARYSQRAANVAAVLDLIRIALGDEWQVSSN